MNGLLRRLAVPAIALAVTAGARVASADVSLFDPITTAVSVGAAGSVSGTLVQEVSGTATILGQSVAWTEDVVTDGTSGDLDFLYQVKEIGTSDVQRVTVANYVTGGNPVTAGYASSISVAGSSLTTAGTLNSPTTADRTLISGVDTIGFNFPAAGNWLTAAGVPESVVFYVKTSTKEYGAGSIAAIDSTTVNISALAPAVPLPATAGTGLALLAGLGVVGGVSVLRRRRQMA